MEPRPRQIPVEDPALRRAVLDLFRANQAYARAFDTSGVAGNLRALEDAQRRIDEARERVMHLQPGP